MKGFGAGRSGAFRADPCKNYLIVSIYLGSCGCPVCWGEWEFSKIMGRNIDHK